MTITVVMNEDELNSYKLKEQRQEEIRKEYLDTVAEHGDLLRTVTKVKKLLRNWCEENPYYAHQLSDLFTEELGEAGAKEWTGYDV